MGEVVQVRADALRGAWSGELDQRLVQIRGTEVGPERGRKEDLRVRGLPDQEVGEPFVTARPDDDVRIRQAGRVHRGGHQSP